MTAGCRRLFEPRRGQSFAVPPSPPRLNLRALVYVLHAWRVCDPLPWHARRVSGWLGAESGQQDLNLHWPMPRLQSAFHRESLNSREQPRRASEGPRLLSLPSELPVLPRESWDCYRVLGHESFPPSIQRSPEHESLRNQNLAMSRFYRTGVWPSS